MPLMTNGTSKEGGGIEGNIHEMRVQILRAMVYSIKRAKED
jgi:hypothetical protein